LFSGWQHHITIQVMVFDPLNLSFRPAVPRIRLNNGFLCSGHQRRYCIQPWASVPRLPLIQGQQCLNFNSGVNPSSLKSNTMLMLTLNAQILVAIYQFGYRMSNTKVSPQLATLDVTVFVSSALYRENFHTYGMKSCIDRRIECLTHYWASTR
jgi:hypothetical protein